MVSLLFPAFPVCHKTVFAPRGGFRSVSHALEKLAQEELGVAVQYGQTVTAVHSSGVYVRSTNQNEHEPTIEDTFVSADLIIVNADLPYATKSLLDRSIRKRGQSIPPPPPTGPRFDWDDSFDFSSGVISFHWSVDMVLEDLNTHNVFLVAGSRSQAEASWQILRNNSGATRLILDAEELHDQDDVSDPPFNFYVHRASKTDPTAAPKGYDSIMVLVPCKILMRDMDCASLPRKDAMEQYQRQFSEQVISETREAVLKRLAAIDSLAQLREHILDEVVDTPATYADQYHLAAGTPFALVRVHYSLAHLTRKAICVSQQD
jgi:phytoene desaturase (3,4-didehydrolycopene-forming)